MKSEYHIYLHSIVFFALITLSLPLQARHYYSKEISLKGGVPFTIKSVHIYDQILVTQK